MTTLPGYERLVQETIKKQSQYEVTYDTEPCLFIQQSNYHGDKEILFYSTNYLARLGGPYTVAIWRVRWK